MDLAKSAALTTGVAFVPQGFGCQCSSAHRVLREQATAGDQSHLHLEGSWVQDAGVVGSESRRSILITMGSPG